MCAPLDDICFGIGTVGVLPNYGRDACSKGSSQVLLRTVRAAAFDPDFGHILALGPRLLRTLQHIVRKGFWVGNLHPFIYNVARKCFGRMRMKRFFQLIASQHLPCFVPSPTEYLAPWSRASISV